MVFYKENLFDYSGKSVIKVVQRAEKKPLKELRIYDLIMRGNRPLKISHGVYFFYSAQGECLYVGKNSSRRFVERIPDHFSLGVDSWMNQFLSHMKKVYNLRDIATAAIKAKNCRLLLMPVGNHESIGKIEKFFKIFLQPKFNSHKDKTISYYKKRIDLNQKLREILKAL